MEELQTYYDAIVIGTGMTESIIAAALSRIGKTVLHLDCRNYYGENWASFNLENIENWIDMVRGKGLGESDTNNSGSTLLHQNEIFIGVNVKTNISNVEVKKFAVECSNIQSENRKKENIKPDENESNETLIENNLYEKMLKSSKKFNLDLCPKLLFSKGLMVELLISSNVAKYAEFKSINRVLTWRNNQLESVPCSRADVFATKSVTVVHKRILVKILTLLANNSENSEEFIGFENRTFLDYLKHKKLPDNLIHYILYAIAMGDDSTSCLNGIKACKAFLDSLGRYGNTPFIFSMYGSGELPQCFCRLCAVFGGVYCLQRGIDGLVIKDNKCVAVISNGVRLNTGAVVLSSSYSLRNHSPTEDILDISRGILVTDRSIVEGDKESLTLLQFPPVPIVLEKPVTVLELNSTTCTCPEDLYVVHLTKKATKKASSDLHHVIETLFNSDNKCDSTPRILWSLFWNVTKNSRKFILPYNNVKICGSVDCSLDYDFSINEAKKIFEELCPEEEFLPRAPDPDEIVFETENKTTVNKIKSMEFSNETNGYSSEEIRGKDSVKEYHIYGDVQSNSS